MTSVAGTEFASRAPTLVTAPLFVCLFLFASVVVGRRVLHLLGATRWATPGERVVAAAAIGLGVLQFVPFLLGAFRILSATSVRIAFALIGVLALLDLPPAIAATRRWSAGRRRLGAWEWAWLVLLVAPLIFSFFIALAPAFDPDGLGYHLTAPKRWLDIGSLEFLPTLTYTNGPMGTEMLYAIALSLVGDAGAKLLHLAAALLATGGVYLIGRRISSAMVGRFACTLFLYGPVGIYGIIGYAYGEATATLAIVASTLCWVIWYKSSDRAWLGPAALLAGLAVTFKLTSVLFPLALALLTVLVVHRRGRRASGAGELSARAGAGLLAIAVAPVVPWLMRSFIVTGNPVFPVLAQWIPSRDFPAEMSRAFETYNRYMLWGTRWGYDLSVDARRVVLGAVGLAVLAMGTLIYLRLRDPLHRVVTVVIVLTVLVQVFAAGLYLRYWIPLGAVLLIPVIALVTSRIDRRVLGVGLLTVTFVLAAGEIRSGVRDSPGELIAASVDARHRDQVLQERFYLSPLYTAASNDSKGNAAVLLTYGCAGFYIDGPSMCTEFLQNSLRLSDWDDFNHDLRALDIGYVIAPTALANGGPRPDDGNGAGSVGFLARDGIYTMVSRLLKERGQLVTSARDQGLYRLTTTVGARSND